MINSSRGRIIQLRKELAERDMKISQLELEQLKLKAEYALLDCAPARLLEWQRQEIVGTAGAVLDILSELSTKFGVVYANVAAIQGVFSNTRALNLSAKSQKDLALAALRYHGGNEGVSNSASLHNSI